MSLVVAFEASFINIKFYQASTCNSRFSYAYSELISQVQFPAVETSILPTECHVLSITHSKSLHSDRNAKERREGGREDEETKISRDYRMAPINKTLSHPRNFLLLRSDFAKPFMRAYRDSRRFSVNEIVGR